MSTLAYRPALSVAAFPTRGSLVPCRGVVARDGCAPAPRPRVRLGRLDKWHKDAHSRRTVGARFFGPFKKKDATTVVEPAPDVAPEPEAEAETAKRQVPSVEDELCAVCLDLEREYAMIPCGHRCLCRGCFDQILGTEAPRCPMCNTFLQGAGGLRVYG